MRTGQLRQKIEFQSRHPIGSQYGAESLLSEIIMHIPMSQGVRLSHDIPSEIKLAIADAVIAFGRIEQELIEIAWIISGADLKQRIKIARAPTKENFTEIIDSFEKTQPDLKLNALKDTVRQLADDRNLVVHGAWTMADDKPWVVWHKFAEDTDSIIGEYFETWRFEKFMIKSLHLLEMLRQFHNTLEGQTGIKTTSVPRLDPT
ncbi:hypothetical protein [Pleomorphomonas sp. PLEO]|uniref:hypothetical protein n=1 Tax=Pleomorphomonas sp. PLEO TaxID=3239306 RepID=UPI00351DC361